MSFETIAFLAFILALAWLQMKINQSKSETQKAAEAAVFKTGASLIFKAIRGLGGR